jgi:hypothetical protein
MKKQFEKGKLARPSRVRRLLSVFPSSFCKIPTDIDGLHEFSALKWCITGQDFAASKRIAERKQRPVFHPFAPDLSLYSHASIDPSLGMTD